MKYFGTDGVRGVANKELTCEIAYKIGSYLGYKFNRIIIGKDTRKSSSMLESAICAGISAYGADAYLLGYTSTPCLAYNTLIEHFDCGIMISASHNPYHDNGIKVFSKNGLKIDSGLEKEIEDYIDGLCVIELAHNDQIGEIYPYHQGNTNYAKWLKDNYYRDIKDLKIVFDLANGGACCTFKEYIKLANYKNILVINDKPDGLNINRNCGSTHLENLIETVKENKCDLGFAFDGDADRVLCVNSRGEVVDGDALMYILAKYFKDKGDLKDDTLVTTVMSNIGLYKALNKLNIVSAKTAVGDKYVVEKMIEGDYSIGGEQSGHIIIAKDNLFGDGLKTALRILMVISDTGLSIEELLKDLVIYPQLLINKKVKDKKIILDDQELASLIEDITRRLGDDGRILVRPSGTEPLIRVMVEAKSDEICKDLCQEVIDLLAKKNYLKD